MDDLGEHLGQLGGQGIELRSAGTDDSDLIRRIVAIAGNWQLQTVPHDLAPELTTYFQDWKRPGDLGVVAFQGIEFGGGAFIRRFRAGDGSYGYISDEYGELTIGIEPGVRRRGLGVLLLAAIKAKAVEADMAGISLSVSPDNGARHLYSKLGFDLVEDRGHDHLMLWRSR